MNDLRSDGVIRITKEETTSSHVDDLLKRQMSLRGEPGVVRDQGRKWYYQSWLVLMTAGTLGALIAWALVEPVFNDRVYFQGQIEAIDLSDQPLVRTRPGAEDAEQAAIFLGSITIRGQRILLVRGAKELLPDGRKQRLTPGSLKEGETVGVHLEFHETPEEDIAVGEFLVREPPPQAENLQALTLSQLSARSRAAGLLLMPLVAALIGLFIGATDGLVCRLPRRALLSGGVGLVVGFVGGLVLGIMANLVYTPFTQLAMKQAGDDSTGLSTFGFTIQMLGRSMAWCLAGSAMGLGQGIALRSKRLLLYGLLGGLVGGLLGGLLFDPIDLLLLGPDKPSAHWSRLIGFGVIGASVGVMVGVVELLARDAWLRMTQGPLTGKEFLLFKDVMNIGSSPRSDLYLFNDPLVQEHHARLRAVGDEYEIEAWESAHPVLLNNHPSRRARLRHGDNVTIGRTVFVFQRRKG